jgi:tetratricopeptide (TPR) repeat protein
MGQINIFLASSNELLAERKEFEIELYRKSKAWREKGIFLNLDIWEDLSARMSANGSQSEYNKFVRGADLFVLLAYTKVGMYTAEEFETAFGKFKSTQKPFIFTYFKTTTGQVEDSLVQFKKKLRDLGHFESPFTDSKDLWDQFNKELERLELDDFRENKTSKFPHTLTPPPFMPKVFLGRDQDLEAIHKKLFDGDNMLLLVNGQGGIGKTSVASKYYHKYNHEYSHVAWVLSEKSIANALLLLAVPLRVRFEDAMPTQKRLDVLLTVMADLTPPCLLVIDNANELKDLEENSQKLRSCSNFHLLITSRINNFEHAECHSIDSLAEPDAKKLFHKLYPKFKTEEEPLFSQIYHAVGGNTLVIEILAKNLASLNQFKDHYSLANLLTEIQEKGLLRISESRVVDVPYHSLKRAKPEEIISAMYDINALSVEEVALISVFAVLPAEGISLTMLESLLPDIVDLENKLLSLLNTGWIGYDEKSSIFKTSPVVQEIVKLKNQNLQTNCNSLIEMLITKLNNEDGHLTGSSYDDALWLSRFAESVSLNFFNSDVSFRSLDKNIGMYYNSIGNLVKALNSFERDYNKCLTGLTLQPNNPYKKDSVALSCQYLGNTHKSLGDLVKALTYYEEYFRLEKELHDAFPLNASYKNNLAVSCQNLGSTYTSLGNMGKAITYYEEYHRLEKELHDAVPQNTFLKGNLASSFSMLGSIYTSMGDLEKALTFNEECYRLEKELNNTFPQNVMYKNNLATSAEHLGSTHTSLGDLQKALPYFEECHQLAKELFDDFPKNVEFKKGLAISFTDLALMQREHAHDKDKAMDFFMHAETLLSELVRDVPILENFKNELGWVQEQMEGLKGT